MNAVTTPIPEAWFSQPPHLLVVGEGAYACALAQILAAAHLRPDQIASEPAPNEAGAYPRVLEGLERVFLVAGISQSAADLLRMHDALWRWVEKLSPAGDQHELAILFVLPPSGDGLARTLAAGLALEQFTPDLPGHGLAAMDDPLERLLAKATALVPQDLPPLRARQAADGRHTALAALPKATSNEARIAAALRVNEAFQGQEYLLDLFCRPPSHRHGNLLRTWLNAVVTNQVTPYNHDSSNESPADWLNETRFP
jgi:hypothetical protein